MEIEGLDYNTQRDKLILPEYGREIQQMVDHAVSLPDKAERQRCAETIIDIMARKDSQSRNTTDYRQKLWDHLALMSNFQLDIDYPCDVSKALKIATKPEPLPYQNNRIAVRHYGKMLLEVMEKLKTMPPGEARDKLVKHTANQMKRNLVQWGHGSVENEKVAADIERLTDGAIKLDLKTFRFDKISNNENAEKKRKRR
ncbi:MAG: DUF4290 domain-containing protein [Prevotella sp.]|nr:DUF4290 domain-containing protein [Prevotella sp.]MDY6230702.1 DUF4290 domain-containing protein [Prevotella sp.]MDY6409422.1 DUF4290 domain-containing protein [Prevotella sp.]